MGIPQGSVLGGMVYIVQMFALCDMKRMLRKVVVGRVLPL